MPPTGGVNLPGSDTNVFSKNFSIFVPGPSAEAQSVHSTL
jgi:hypothetical protein